MSKHPSFGPMTPEEMSAALAAPYGKAAEIVRKHDPHFGKAAEDKKWRVTFSRQVTERGYAIVKAATEEEANELAMDVPDADVKSLDYDDPWTWEIDEVEPA